jgi:hypothetical protein
MRVTWTEVRTQPKGFFDLVEGKLDTKAPNPPTDLRLPGSGTLIFDDSSFRADVQRKKWSTKFLKVMDTDSINVYKYDKDISLTRRSTIVEYPDAEIVRRTKSSNVMEYTYWPITCFARGLSLKFAPFDIDQYELTGNTQVVDKSRCIELTRISRANNNREIALIDPSRGFLLVRYYIVTDGRVTTRLDVKYATDPKINWIPKSWDYAISTPIGGWRLGSSQITLEAYEINADLATDTFDLLLPPGTRVYDEYEGPAKQYMIRDDGDAGPAVPDAGHPTYEHLAELARKETRWLSSGGVIVIASTILVLAVLILAWRRMRRIGSDPPPFS